MKAASAAHSRVRDDRLADLFDGHADRLYRLARRLTPSRDDARDLVQETFLRAAKSVLSIPVGRPSEEAWLVRVLINLRKDEWRKSATRRRLQLAPVVPTNGDLESSLDAKRAVWRALDALHPRRRAVVVMHELEGMDVQAIATVLGITAVTVRWHLCVGRRELKRVLTGDLR
jgi:RNA polymerase sigma-70 factor (ECF subfamily)